MLTFKNINKITTLFLIGILIYGIYTRSFFELGYAISGLGVIWLFFTIMGSFNITWNYHLRAFNKEVRIKQKKIVITFDDGPNSTYTLQVLNLLNRYNATATFFCIGKHIEQSLDLVRTISEQGHTIGNHSYSHSSFFDFYGAKKVIEEIERTDALIEKITGKKVTIFRPPFGVTNPSIANAIKQTKHKVIGWNIRSLDTVIKDEGKIIGRITKKITPGAIILLHDSHDRILPVLEQLLIFLQDNDYQTVSLETLCNIKTYEQ